jgi:ABC-type multidrug transport system fused ATPase/permease subunit
MLGFVKHQHPGSEALRLEKLDREKAFASGVETVASRVRMIIDYQRRATVMDEFETQIGSLNKAINVCRKNDTRNAQFAPCLASFIIGAYVFLAGSMVLRNSMSMGVFLITVDIYTRMADSWEKTYSTVLVISASLPALDLISWHMNLSTDLWQRRALRRKSREVGQEERKRVREKPKPKGTLYAIDMMAIKMNDVMFDYTSHAAERAGALDLAPHKGKKPKVERVMEFSGVQNISLEIEQGNLVAMVGKRGSGKSTLLKILGSVIIPDGTLYIPVHLRVIHVAQDPVFFFDTIYNNLRYGAKPGSPNASEEHILRICRLLRVSEHVMQLIKDAEMRNWDEELSLTQKQSLHLARALVADPEVLIVHKPSLPFDDETAGVVYDALRSFVHDNGIDPQGDVKHRRRRTCIMSCARISGCQTADQIILVNVGGVRTVAYEDLSEDMVSS